jgi:ABC-type sugar transport system ATPase subunit
VATVSFQHVDKRYSGGCHAVRDLNLEIADGELVVLVGPSGCGKTTTLRLLAGLEEPTSGELWIGARRVNDIEPSQRDIAMVLQSGALYPHLTVRKNLEFGLHMRGTSKAETARRVGDAVDLLGIAPLLDRKPAELSGGQQQRVALGRALVRQPQAFLLDEPLSNLDAQLRGQLRNEIASLHRKLGTTMIYVTHDQVEAMTLGQRIVVMNEGVVQQAAPPLEVYRRPANRFVAGFIGNPPMNFAAGKLNADRFVSHGGELSLNGCAGASGAATLGIRPEDLVFDGSGPTLGPVIVESIEYLGHESIAYFQFAGQRWAMRLAADAELAPGATIQPRFRPGSWHLFADDAAGLRLA